MQTQTKKEGLDPAFMHLELGDDAPYLSLLTQLKPEKKDVEWATVTITENLRSGQKVFINRLPVREMPTMRTISAQFNDGEIHNVRLTFTDTEGGCVGWHVIDVLSKSSAVETQAAVATRLDPNLRVVSILEAQAQQIIAKDRHTMELFDRVLSSVEKREAFAAEVMRDQAKTTAKMQAQLVDKVGALETQRATDPKSVMLGTAWDIISPLAGAGLEAGMDWMDENGGFVKLAKKGVETVTNAKAHGETLGKMKDVAVFLRDTFVGQPTAAAPAAAPAALVEAPATVAVVEKASGDDG